MSKKGTLYLVPVPIAEGALHTLPAEVLTHTKELKHYFTESARTSRRFLRSLHKDLVLEDITFSEIDKHAGPNMNVLRKWLNDGIDVGIMSEAGCPGIADPGSEMAAVAHQVQARIVPLTGPNSLVLALMASGLNGQSFCFNGYLPIKEPARGQKVKELEAISKKENQTQLFIETPYRNNQLLDEFLRLCNDSTKLCIAQNISAPNASIRTKTIGDWKQHKPALEKSPAVFLILA